MISVYQKLVDDLCDRKCQVSRNNVHLVVREFLHESGKYPDHTIPQELKQLLLHIRTTNLDFVSFQVLVKHILVKSVAILLAL